MKVSIFIVYSYHLIIKLLLYLFVFYLVLIIYYRRRRRKRRIETKHKSWQKKIESCCRFEENEGGIKSAGRSSTDTMGEGSIF